MENKKRLIDASAVLETQFTAGLSDASGNYYGHADVVFASDIENAPTVDAEPVRHGRWIEDEPYRDEDGYIIHQYYCSECGRYEEEKEPYCNCGAKMDLEE